ncbi:CHAT domain-containing protein [Actinomadura violacea]|uniref:CHAT domain-containing protein n=1 Tax=Actinomadura violacea TaxID=2819934 RepID=A0ABS3RNY7_9ACTN|nr:CHAT domain-containing protein [Actinomadura violacea]MBO2458465.1 CHAT domain-containing protein [Actinomadura violacea]
MMGEAASLVKADTDRLLAAAAPDGLLDLTVARWRRILALVAADHPGRAGWLCDFGVALTARFDRDHAAADLNEAVRVTEEATEAATDGSAAPPAMLSNLAGLLRDRNALTDSRDDLERAIEAGRKAVDAAGPGHPVRPQALSNLAGALLSRYADDESEEDLDEAIALLEEAAGGASSAGVASGSAADRARWAANLGLALRVRYNLGALEADLGRAIALLREAVGLAPAGHPDRPHYLMNLGGALYDRYEIGWDPADLDAAVRHLREAVEATAETDPALSDRLGLLCVCLLMRYESSGALADLGEAVRSGRIALARCAPGDPARGVRLSDMSGILSRWYDHTGDAAALDEAVDCVREALAASTEDDALRPVFLSNLGGLLQNRYERSGTVADLDEAVDRLRLAVFTSAPDDAGLPVRLSNLGTSLQARFEELGAMGDLAEAMAVLQEAVGRMPAGHPAAAAARSNLASALDSAHDVTGSPQYLAEAIDHMRAAVEGAPPGNPDRAVHLTNLGNLLYARYEADGDLDDLDRGIDCHRLAADAAGQGRAGRATLLSNLGGPLQARFDRTGDPADLDRAITVLSQARDEAAPGHPIRVNVLFNLGNVLRIRHERAGAPEDLRDAIGCMEEAAGVASAAPVSRVRAAYAGGMLAADAEPERAADLLETAVRLLPLIVPRRLDRADQRRALADLPTPAANAASVVLNGSARTPSGRAELALRLLETGRSVLLGQALESREDLTDLARAHPAPAERFADLHERLNAPPSLNPAGRPADDDRRELAAAWAGLLTEIRSLPGFASFALPPSHAELAEQAADGPIVTVNISLYGSDALILDSDGLVRLPLPDVSSDALTRQVAAFDEALETIWTSRSPLARRAAERGLLDVLAWLWDAIAHPVLGALGHDGAPRDGHWPRLWWAPGGLLGRLPLHAAGLPGGPAVMDRVISSYTASVTALRHSRRNARRAARAEGPALVVAMPTTPGGAERLDHVEAEARAVRRLLPGAAVLGEPGTATRAAVLAALADCPIAHFACHGVSDPSDPSGGRLLLADHEDAPLTVADLGPLDLRHARLAYLSACGTARVADRLVPDEGATLASAFQLAGYPHVIGTLWEIGDEVAARVAEAFYTTLTRDAAPGLPDVGRSAAALHRAVRAVRAERPGTPSLWAAHLHTGA